MYMVLLNLIGATLVCLGLWVLYMCTNYGGATPPVKSSPFECGFEACGAPRRPFSVRYFVLVVLFLLFDVEAVLLFPCLSKFITGFSLLICVRFFLFLLLLVVGLLYEWKNKILE